MRFSFLLFILAALLAGCGSPAGEEAAADWTPGPEQLLMELTDEERFVSVDKVADWIISEDPTLLLVDVRPHEAYDRFSLPGAVNIPAADFMDESKRSQLDCETRSVVLFANGTVLAEELYLLGRRLGCRNIYIMQGGLNDWARKILDPQEPGPSASADAFETYQFRVAARQYFMGESRPLEAEPYVQPVVKKAEPKKEIVPQKKKRPAPVEEEGC